jgi:hypothetical protein
MIELPIMMREVLRLMEVVVLIQIGGVGMGRKKKKKKKQRRSWRMVWWGEGLLLCFLTGRC